MIPDIVDRLKQKLIDYDGTEIAYNKIYDKNEDSYAGIYLDYRSMNAWIHHNLIYNIRFSLLTHSPVNLTIEHNTFIGNPYALANPKSANFILSLLSINKFCGFKSLCIIFALCNALNPNKI